MCCQIGVFEARRAALSPLTYQLPSLIKISFEVKTEAIRIIPGANKLLDKSRPFQRRT
jgi:hypothetical protein